VGSKEWQHYEVVKTDFRLYKSLYYNKFLIYVTAFYSIKVDVFIIHRSTTHCMSVVVRREKTENKNLLTG